MEKYRYVLFDLDGTLTYSHPGIFACFRYALKEMGQEEPTPSQLKKCIGPSLVYSFMHFFGMDEESAIEATAKYRERYSVIGWQENEPIAGALACLEGLKKAGYRLALATSKPKIYADKIVEKFGFSKYLDAQVGPSMDGKHSSKAEVIREAMEKIGAKKAETLMVGDRNYDAEGAIAEGVDCALLKIGGYAEEEELYSCGARYVLEDFAELEKLLLK